MIILNLSTAIVLLQEYSRENVVHQVSDRYFSTQLAKMKCVVVSSIFSDLQYLFLTGSEE